MKKLKNILILLIVSVSFFGCFNFNNISNENMVFLYKKDSPLLSLETKLCHENDSSSTLFLRFDNQELLYKKPENKDFFQAEWNFEVMIFDAFDTKKLVDSLTFSFVDSISNGKAEIKTHSLQIPISSGRKYMMSVSMTDVYRKQDTRKVFQVDKENKNAEPYFRLINEKNYLEMDNVVEEGEKYRIAYYGDADSICVFYFNKQFPIAKPPFSVEEDDAVLLERDSSFVLSIEDGKTDYFQLKKTGFYFFRTDTTQNKGFTAFVFYPNFPNVVLPEHMLFPTRYVMTAKEFNPILMSSDKKAAVENFWIEQSGSKERARKMISEYYNRVVQANRFFTSYHEGWKTDRGMAFIVMGTPNIVYKTINFEKWVYGEEHNMMSVTLTFTHVQNPYTNNDFRLNRVVTYKEIWYRSVDTWRR
jgi:GWxTD domain-containing protein